MCEATAVNLIFNGDHLRLTEGDDAETLVMMSIEMGEDTVGDFGSLAQVVTLAAAIIDAVGQMH